MVEWIFKELRILLDTVYLQPGPPNPATVLT